MTGYIAHYTFLISTMQKARNEMNKLSTYQIYLILLGYLAEQHDDTEMLKSMLIELYKRANKTESEK